MTGATATFPRSSGNASLSLDVLSGLWRSALDAAQSALRAAGPVLPSSALRERSVHLRLERAIVAHELEALAHDRHTEASFSDLQIPAESLRRPLSRGRVKNSR